MKLGSSRVFLFNCVRPRHVLLLGDIDVDSGIIG